MVERRLWLLFFDNGRPSWWSRFLKTGFRHVTAAAWFADQERWVFFNPAMQGIVVEVWREDEFHRRYVQLLADSTAVLRFPSQGRRRGMPPVFFCVGAIKALLGLRSGALSAWSLYRHLLAEGADIVEVPRELVSETEAGCAAATGAGRPGNRGDAQAGAAAG